MAPGRDGLAARRAAYGRPPNPVGVVIAGHEPVPLDARWFTGDERRILIVGRDNPIEAAPEGTELVRARDARPGTAVDPRDPRGARDPIASSWRVDRT